MTRTTIARLLVLLVVWSLTALFVVLQADRVAGIRLAAAEEDAMEIHRLKELPPEGIYIGKSDMEEVFDKVLNDQMQRYLWDYVTNRNPENGAGIGSAIYACAQFYDIDPLLILAIIEQESSFQLRNPKTKDGRGLAGEYGLMQIHPCWVGNPAIGSPTVAELWSIDGNIAAGVAIFKRGYTNDYMAGLGAYNRGHGRSPEYERKVDARYKRIVMEFYFRLSGRR